MSAKTNGASGAIRRERPRTIVFKKCARTIVFNERPRTVVFESLFVSFDSFVSREREDIQRPSLGRVFGQVGHGVDEAESARRVARV